MGTALTGRLLDNGHRVKILTRKIKPGPHIPDSLTFVEGNVSSEGEWMKHLTDCDAVINLAGASIFKRWTENYKDTLLNSRILSTENIVQALENRKKDDVVLISASAVGYYGFHGDEKLYEDNPPGSDFLALLSKEWEETACKAEKSGVRVITDRLGVVAGKSGGALGQMIPVFKYRLGSPLGSGQQFFSWIHIKDLTDIFLMQVENRGLRGPFNCTAPNPVTNRELTGTLALVMNKPVFLPPVPGFVLKLVMGEFADVLLKGQRVFPKRLIDSGYNFRFPEIESALRDILS